jgi:hypothetical protein
MTRRVVAGQILLTLIPAMAVSLALAGTAEAFWQATGAGTGTGSTGATTGVSIGPGSPSAAMYPGGTGNVVLTITNPNTAPVHIGSLALDTGRGTGGFIVDAGHAGCAVTALTFTTQTNAGAGWTIPAKAGAINGTLPVTLTNALAMAASAANACQGATSTIYLMAGP